MNSPPATQLIRSLRPPRCALSGIVVPGPLALSRESLTRLPRPDAYCRHCLLPIAASAVRVCGKCLDRPKFHRACAPFDFRLDAQRLVHLFKYHSRPGLSRTLAVLMAEEVIRRSMPKPQLLLPMPLHPLRLARRGYNQAALLAQELSELLDIPWSPTHLRRVRKTPPLTGLGLEQRKRHLAGAMRAEMPPGIAGVAVIDDVLTSGSSALEAARAIRACTRGCQVQIWTFAHRV